MSEESMKHEISQDDYEAISRLSGIHDHEVTVGLLIKLSGMDEIPAETASSIRRLMKTSAPPSNEPAEDVVSEWDHLDRGPQEPEFMAKPTAADVQVEAPAEVLSIDALQNDHDRSISESHAEDDVDLVTPEPLEEPQANSASNSMVEEDNQLVGDPIDIGSLVTVVYLETGEEKFIEIMPAGTQNDPERGRLHAETPLAKAMIGRRENEEFSISVKGMELKLRITGVAS